MGVTPITVPTALAQILNTAGERSGVDFDYLLQTAIRESSLNPTAKAATSSATGLFQFLDSTWLQVMKDEGPRLGYQSYADAITQNGDGDYVIKDPKLRAEVLKLREDPAIAADMAAAFTRNNGAYLYEKFGRMPSAGELYIAHFLGAGGAGKLFSAGLENPDQIAAKLFPRQAAANPSIFYDHGTARTIREVYKSLVAKHDGQPAAAFSTQQLQGGATLPALAAPVTPLQPLEGMARSAPQSRFGPKDMSFTALFSTGLEGAIASPVEPIPAGQGAAFFTQLYGQ
ncbi:MAG: lytic transglycosylase protein [Devosia sp.]|nr:lytic transglycosylase protein [Devosia sp.]